MESLKQKTMERTFTCKEATLTCHPTSMAPNPAVQLNSRRCSTLKASAIQGSFPVTMSDLHDLPRSDSLQASNYEKLLIKSGCPDKARSNVEVGDKYYFNGPHMWQTT